MIKRQLQQLAVLAMAIAAICLAIAPQARAQGELSIIALVNDEPISAYDVVQRVRFMSATTRKQPSEAMRKKAIDDLINENLQLQEAKKQNVVVSDDQVNNALNNIAKGNGMTGAQMTQALGQLGINAGTFKNRLRATIAWQQVVRRKFARQVRVNETDVEKAMKGSGGDTKVKTEFDLQRVRLKLPSGAKQTAITARLAEAEQLRDKFESCSSISSLVGRVQNASVQALGKKTADQIKQPARAYLLGSSMGQMTPAIVTPAGVELYAICAKKAVQQGAKNERKTIENKLRQQEFVRLSRRFIRDLRQDAYIEIR